MDVKIDKTRRKRQTTCFRDFGARRHLCGGAGIGGPALVVEDDWPGGDGIVGRQDAGPPDRAAHRQPILLCINTPPVCNPQQSPCLVSTLPLTPKLNTL